MRTGPGIDTEDLELERFSPGDVQGIMRDNARELNTPIGG